MKNGKAPGPGAIPGELLKYEPDILLELLASTFNQFLRGEELPEELNTAYISNIYKKGDRQYYALITVEPALQGPFQKCTAK